MKLCDAGHETPNATPESASARPAENSVVENAGSPRADVTWGLLYRVGGWSAVLYVLLVVVAVVLVFLAPLPPTQGAALLEYIAAHQAVYLTEPTIWIAAAEKEVIGECTGADASGGFRFCPARVCGLFEAEGGYGHMGQYAYQIR